MSLASALFYHDPSLSVLPDKEGFLQLGDIGEGFLRVDRHKLPRLPVFPDRQASLGDQEEFHLPFPQPLGRNFLFQAEVFPNRHHYAQNFFLLSAADCQAAYHISGDPAPAEEPVIKAFPPYLYLAPAVEAVAKCTILAFLCYNFPKV